MSAQVQRVLSIALFALLLLWGGWTLLAYLSVPVHQLVLVSEIARTNIEQACPGGGALCRGLQSLLPFIGQTFVWAAPFLWYGVASLALYLCFAGWQFLKKGEWTLRLTMRPWHVLLLFLGSLWLVFMVIALGNDDGQPMRRIVEPLSTVYQSASLETIAALQENFDDLKMRGCLEFVGTAQVGADVYDMRLSCMQTTFFTRVLSQAVLVLLFLFDLLILGRLFLRRMRAEARHPLVELIVSAGAGVGILIAILWLIAVLGLYTTLAGWIVVLAIPLIGWRHAAYWLRRFFVAEWRVEERMWSVTLLLAWLLLAYLALNFLSVVRPFPIGWDDLGRYLNHPRLLVSYGHFISPMATFQWEYLTSLGFLLFGYDTVMGSTFALMINWTEGLLALLSIYILGRVFLGPRRGLLATLVFYSLPLIGHFSFADMKVDNAVFAMGTLSMLSFFLALLPTFREMQTEEDGPSTEAPPQRSASWMVLAGAFAGLAFAMKPTAVMVVMSLATILFGMMIHGAAFAGTALLAWAFYTFHGEFNLGAVSQYVYGDAAMIRASFVYAICLGGGLLLFGYGLWRRRSARAAESLWKTALPAFRMFLIFIGSMIAAMSPWLAYNNFQYGKIIPGIVTGAPEKMSPLFSLAPITDYIYPGQDVRVLPAELRPVLENGICKGSSRAEEVDRYWGGGYAKGWGHYLTLPYRTVMNLDSAGYYVTTIPGLLLFPLLFLIPFVWTRRGRMLRWLGFATLFAVVQWIFFANGIPWYGVGMFLGTAIALEALCAYSPHRATRWLAALFVTLSLFTAFCMRLWQFEQQVNLYEYPIGKVSAAAIRQRTIPHYDLIRDIVVERHDTMPERPYTYRVGTFITYFIPKSIEYLPMTDNQLDFFNCLYVERDPELTLKRLKALGFSSVIFDTNTHTIEKDPNGTLHKKVQLFLDFLNTPSLGLQIVVNDPDGGVAFVLIP